jgi:hypothetical protein
MEIRFQSLTGTTATLKASPTATVKDLRSAIGACFQIRSANLAVIFHGTLLRDGHALSWLNLQPNEFLTVFDRTTPPDRAPLPQPPRSRGRDYMNDEEFGFVSRREAVRELLEAFPHLSELEALTALDNAHGNAHMAMHLIALEMRRPPFAREGRPEPPPDQIEDAFERDLFLRRMRGTTVDTFTPEEMQEVWTLVREYPRVPEMTVVEAYVDCEKQIEAAREYLTVA